MEVSSEHVQPQNTKKNTRGDFPQGLAIALGLLLGVAAGAGSGHLLLYGLVGVLAGGGVEIGFALMKKRAK